MKRLRLPRSAKVRRRDWASSSFFLILTIIGPWIAPYNPSYNGFLQNLPPSAKHWLGTTALGEDIFSQLLDGARATIVVAVVAGLVATLIAVVVGVSAGYLGGRADDGLSLLSNVFLAIPGLPLLIVIDSYLPEADRSNSLILGLRDRPDRVGVGRAGPARPDDVAAQSRLRRGVAHHRREPHAHHGRRDRAEPPADPGVVAPLHDPLLHRRLRDPRLHRAHLARRCGTGGR